MRGEGPDAKEPGRGQKTGDGAAFRRVLEGAAKVARLLWERGWAERNAGNLSCDVTGIFPAGRVPVASITPLEAVFPELAGRCVLVTGAGSRMRDVARQPADWCGVLRLSDDGGAYGVQPLGDEGTGFVPTSELPSHLAIHAALRRRGAAPQAVVHTHPTELLALSLEPGSGDEGRFNRLLWSLHPEAVVVVPSGVAVVPYMMPGTVEQGIAAGRAMETHDVALWRKHGAVAVGEDFGAAFDLLDTVNKAARLYLLCRSAGIVPEGLSDAQVEELRRAYGPRPTT
jgi:rhamnulose-1-phosphate aldolase